MTALAYSGFNPIHTYRVLLRSLLRVVQYSSPAKYEVRARLRDAFRHPNAAALRPDEQTMKRTLWFLDAAARESGLEHRIVRNLLQVGWERRSGQRALRSGVTSASQ